MANWETQCAQPERVQENVHLMSHTHGAVLEVAVIETEAGVQEKFSPRRCELSDFDLPRKINRASFQPDRR